MRSARSLLLAAASFVALLGACSSGGTKAAPPAPPPVTSVAERVTCEAGTMGTVAGTSCAPVGPTAIPAGFVAAESGWGFHATRPAAACTGATRAAIGNAACVPLDDCDAAFPPAGALVVTEKGPTSLADALEGAAPSSVIAVDRGTYLLPEHAGRLLQPGVRVVGRCARDVVIQGDGTNAAIGIPRGEITIESVTLRNFEVAVALSGSTASLRATHVLFEGNGLAVDAQSNAHASLTESVVDARGRRDVSADPIRAVVTQHGGKVEVVASDVRDVTRAFTAFDKGSEVHVRRSVATTRDVGDDLFLLAMVSGYVEIDESVVAVERGSLLNVGQSRRYSKNATDDARLRIHASELDQTGTYNSGGALAVLGGALLTIEESTIRHLSPVALTAFEEGSRAKLTSSALVARPTKNEAQFAIDALQGSHVELEGTAVVGARGTAIAAFDEGTTLALTRSLVTQSRRAASPNGGAAASFSVVVMKNAKATFTDSAISANEESGLVIANEAEVNAQGLLVDGTTTSAEGALGEGIYVSDDARLSMVGSAVCQNGWLGLVMMRASGTVTGTRFEDNAAGAVNVWETAVSRPAAPAEPVGRELVLADVTFRGSAPEVQEGEVEVILPPDAVDPGF
jgi:hypothetical protein